MSALVPTDAGGASAAEKLPNDRIARLRDLIIGCRTPGFGKRLAETVHEALGERIEGKRVKAVRLLGMAARRNALREIIGRIAFVADREDTMRHG